jgi:hypothetical protein
MEHRPQKRGRKVGIKFCTIGPPRLATGLNSNKEKTNTLRQRLTVTIESENDSQPQKVVIDTDLPNFQI